MNLISLIDDYLKESLILKKPDTYDFDLKVSRAMKKCLEYLSLNDSDQFKKDTPLDFVVYFKQNTKKKNSGINQTIEWFYSVFNYFEMKSNLPKYKPLPDDTESFKHFKKHEVALILRFVRDSDVRFNNNLIYSLAVFLFLDTGLRTSELVNLKVKNIDFSERSIFVEKTKNGKSRYVYFTDLSFATLKKVLSLSQSSHVFINLIRPGEQLTKRAIRYFLDKMKKALRFDKLHAHQFRKTFAMKLLENGAGLEVIQKLLGHSDIKMTMVYLDVYDYYVAKEYKKYQPKYE